MQTDDTKKLQTSLKSQGDRAKWGIDRRRIAGITESGSSIGEN